MATPTERSAIRVVTRYGSSRCQHVAYVLCLVTATLPV